MITGLDHIAVAVTNLDLAVTQWEKLTGHVCTHREIVADQRVEVAVMEIGTLRIELIAPTSPDSPIVKFLNTRGSGLHHIALRADRAQEVLDRAIREGLPVIDQTTRQGAEDTCIGFFHPRATGGVLVEVVERKAGD